MIAAIHHRNKLVVWNTDDLSQKQLGSIQAEIDVYHNSEGECICLGGSGGKVAYASQITRDRRELSVWNINSNERTARIEFDGYFCFVLSNSGDRIVVWIWQTRMQAQELMMFNTCSGLLQLSMSCADPIECVACSHDVYWVVSHWNGKITVWNVATGELESTTEFDIISNSRSCIILMVCSNAGDRPLSCVGCTWPASEFPRTSLIVWDIISEEKYVEISIPHPLELLSFGVTDSIIVGAYGHNDNDEPICQCTVNVWKLDSCERTNHLQANLLSHFDLHGATNLTMCFNPVINALIYVDNEDDRFIIVDIETGIEICSIEAPVTTNMQFMIEGGVILL